MSDKLLVSFKEPARIECHKRTQDPGNYKKKHFAGGLMAGSDSGSSRHSSGGLMKHTFSMIETLWDYSPDESRPWWCITALIRTKMLNLPKPEQHISMLAISSILSHLHLVPLADTRAISWQILALSLCGSRFASPTAPVTN